MGLGAFIFLSAAGAATPCYPVEPKVVTVTGILRERGEPHDGYFVLSFRPPICTIGYSDDEMDKVGYYDESRPSVAEMQLVLLGSAELLYEELRPALGKNVRCTGTLFDAQTVHHMTPVLVQVMHEEDCRVVGDVAKK